MAMRKVTFLSRPAALMLFAPWCCCAAGLGCRGGAAVTGPEAVEQARRIPADREADVRALAAANNAFAFDLYARLRGSSGNLFLSPYSISTAFAMAYAGAGGLTAAEMRAALHFSLPDEQLHPAFAALSPSLGRGAGLGGYELAAANRLWGQQGFSFVPAFLDRTR